MEIAENRKEIFEQIAESFSWALSHSRVSLESLGEFATLLYLCKHDQLRKVSNSDCKEGENLFVLQFSPSMIGDEMEKWMRYNIACIGLMRKAADQNPEIETILQRYRTTMRQHQAQDALIRTYDLIKQAELQDNEYLELLVYIETDIVEREGHRGMFPICPRSLSQMIAGILHDEHKSIYDPYIGTASLLMDIPYNVELFGSENNVEVQSYTTLKLALRGAMDFCVSYPVVPDEVTEIPGTCIISFPPIFGTPQSDRASFEFPIKLFREDDKITELVLVLPEVFMSSDRYKDIRKSLTDANLLDKIIGLPNGYFYNTALTACIVHLYKGRTEESEITIGNLAEDAEKVGRRKEIDKGLFDQLINPFVESEENGKIVKYDVRDPQDFHYPDDIAKNDYDWSCNSYAIDTNATGIPYGGDTKPFMDIVERYYGKSLKGWPEKAISIRRLNSPFEAPEEISPKGTRATGYVRITEPVLIIGYSNKCPLYYLEASEDDPKYLDRREILYRCVDPLVDPLYLSCTFSKSVDTYVHFDEYIYAGFIDANRKIEKFLRAQQVGLPGSLPAQISRAAEWKESYFREQLKDSELAKYVEALKKQYIDEVRSRKHNMRPFLREIKSSVDLARLYAEKASSLEELKAKVLPLLDSIESNGEGLANIVERLSQEEKFEEPEYLDVMQTIQDCVAYYRQNTAIQFSIIQMSDEPEYGPVDPDNCETWGRYANCSSYDFRRMFNAIVENARVHGFEGHDEGHHIEITIDYDGGHFKIGFRNDGLPFPEGFDINQYGMLGGKAGKYAGTGDGGHQVVSIADHFGGWVEIDSSKPGNPQQYSEVFVYLRVEDKDFDESLSEFKDNLDLKQHDDV